MPDTQNKDKPKERSSNLFPVVGVGASAGGLEAFKRLIRAIPEARRAPGWLVLMMLMASGMAAVAQPWTAPQPSRTDFRQARKPLLIRIPTAPAGDISTMYGQKDGRRSLSICHLSADSRSP